MATESPAGYLLGLLAKQEALVELGLAEAAADGAHGAVVRGAVIEPSEVEELGLPGHVLGESFKAGPGGKKTKERCLGPGWNGDARIQIKFQSGCGKESYLIKALDSSLPSVWSERQ